MERQFGVTRFPRSTRGTEPTAQGQSLVQFARRTLVILGRTRQALVKILPSSLSLYLLPVGVILLLEGHRMPACQQLLARLRATV